MFFWRLLFVRWASEASEQSERAKLYGAARVGADMNFWMSGAFLCLLLLLWVLLLLLVLLPLVGKFGPLQLHVSTTFKTFRASRSLIKTGFFCLLLTLFVFFFRMFF